ncbi:MAG TPA: glycosyltransferase [Gemmataceae bacterium]|nr:glycosyltransferase [Gemmataceae bacterium]
MTEKQTTVSIIVPCYNGARFLHATLESAVSQTRPPLEVIVIDDGSTDDSAAIAESFGAPVRLIRQLNQGESVARNKGIAVAKGTHLLFLDADDLLGPQALEVLSTAVDTVPGSVALMGCGWFESDPSKSYVNQLPRYNCFFPHIIAENLGPIHCWLTPTKLIQQIGGFNEQRRWFEDWDLWCQVGLTGTPLVVVPFVGAFYRRHPGAQSATSSELDRALGHCCMLERLCRSILPREDLLQAHGETLFWCAWTGLHTAKVKGANWRELELLAACLSELARKGPAGVRGTWYARMIRYLGVRWAETVRNLYLRRQVSPA